METNSKERWLSLIRKLIWVNPGDLNSFYQYHDLPETINIQSGTFTLTRETIVNGLAETNSILLEYRITDTSILLNGHELESIDSYKLDNEIMFYVKKNKNSRQNNVQYGFEKDLKSEITDNLKLLIKQINN